MRERVRVSVCVCVKWLACVYACLLAYDVVQASRLASIIMLYEKDKKTPHPRLHVAAVIVKIVFFF